ncbi:LPXTG cell wall anchor domain-containing protein [Enterococcus spodopteracolus]|uniref:LPXTG cell wall anchor domain-containing protein n=1 Tax=Enterococcus spodopteracolus TaxID=3034501 RepID=UPI0026483E0A|nr:LPXTG cell wall anchor domain-containing protein [Enterococcus spodopteracolus]
MKNKRIHQGILWLVLTVGIFSFHEGQAAEVQRVETPGSIGFTGTYVPIGSPDPAPIEGPPITDSAKPGGSLPQTNEVTESSLIWLGLFLLSGVFICWKQTNNQKNKQKAGIIT